MTKPHPPTKQLVKPSKDQIARARAYIDSMNWRFARTMPQCPHWWVLRENGSAREFDFVAGLIKRFGYPDKWGSRTNSYLVIGKFKYWIIDDCLNRAAPLSNAEFRRRELRYCARHGKKIGPYGRLINDPTMRKKSVAEKNKAEKHTCHELEERVYDLPNTRSDMTIKSVRRAVAKFLRDDIRPDQIHFTPRGVHLCEHCRRKTNVKTLKDLI